MPEYSVIDLFDKINMTALPTYAEEEKLASLSEEEIRAINERLSQLVENEEVFGALWEARDAIYNAVRAVKKWTKTDFKGFDAEGDELDLDIVDALDVVKNGTALGVFEQTVTAGVDEYWSESGGAKVKLDEDTAIVIVGWYDNTADPVATRVEMQLPKKTVIVKTPFKLKKDVPLVVHAPVVIKPKESFKVRVRYEKDGTDALRPIAVKITKAQNNAL